MPSPELTAQLQDYRARVLEAIKLRKQGDEAGASALMPDKDEIIQAVKAWRQSMGERQTSRSASATTKQKASRIANLENLGDLFK